MNTYFIYYILTQQIFLSIHFFKLALQSILSHFIFLFKCLYVLIFKYFGTKKRARLKLINLAFHFIPYCNNLNKSSHLEFYPNFLLLLLLYIYNLLKVRPLYYCLIFCFVLVRFVLVSYILLLSN